MGVTSLTSHQLFPLLPVVAKTQAIGLILSGQMPSACGLTLAKVTGFEII